MRETLGDGKPLFTPSDFIRYFAENRKVSVDTIKVPERLLMTYQRSTYECAKNLINGKSVESLYGESQPSALDYSIVWKLEFVAFG